jgi:DNA-binding NtrC family response regulator
MPGMNGVELIAAARKICPALAALLVTGRAEANDVAAGDFEILRKPFHIEFLALQVARAIERCQNPTRELHVV